MKVVKHISEFGTIWNLANFLPEKPSDSFDQIFLDEQSFQSVKNFVAENNDSQIEIDQAFSVHRQKGRDFIRVKNYVGVIETRQGTTIEILPKIYRQKTCDNQSQITESKILLMKMLRCLKDAPFRSIDKAHLKASRMPIIEIFITIFLSEMEKLLKRGIKHFYSSQFENQFFLKGKLQFNENIKFNSAHRERFYVHFDEFKTDISQNRIIKATLVYLIDKSQSTKNKRQINSFLQLFEDVSTVSNLTNDFQKINGHNRLFTHYDLVIKWAKVFLLEQSFTCYKGNHLNTAILFPMETLFESYVAHKLKQQHPDWNITSQDRKYFLVTDIIQNQQKFRIKPDLVIDTGDSIIIADTKWKIIDQNQSKKNYLISQADMYQLFAYGKKYNIMQLVLIYPHCESFDQELHFEYEKNREDFSGMNLCCLPWSFENENTLDIISFN